MIINMNSRNTKYIVSLVVLLVGIAVIGSFVHTHRQREYFAEMTAVNGSDQNLVVNGKIIAKSSGHQLGKSRFPDEYGDVILQPETAGGSVHLKSNAHVNGRLVIGDSICIGDTVNCLTKDMLQNLRSRR